MSNSSVIHVDAASFSDKVLSCGMPVLVDFWASWCGPCRALAPVIDELAADYEGKARICKLDVDAEGALAAQYGVMSIPTVILFHQGQEKTRVVGLRGKESFAAELDKLL